MSKSLALAAGALAVAGWAGPWVLRADLFEDDAAQHTFWLYRYADATLFPGDPTADYFGLASSAPWGYRTLYATLAPYVDVLAAGEWLAAMLFAACLALGWAIGRRVAPVEQRDAAGLLGLAAVAWLVYQDADALTPLALQRSFALPLTLLLLWALLAGRWAWIGVCWLLAALFYPVVVVVLGMTGGLAMLLDTVRGRRLPPWWAWNAVAGLAAIGIVLASTGVPPDVGPTVGREALAMPEFGADGRLRLLFGSVLVDGFRNHLLGLGWSPATLLLLAGCVAMARLVRPRLAIPLAAWLLLGTGVATWLAARLVLFELYLPNRHSRWAIAGFAVVALVVGGVAVLQALARRHPQFTAARASLATGLGATALVAALAVPAAVDVWRTPVDRDLERAYAYLASLPSDTLVGAHPDVADFIPLRSRRAVLASTETSLPFMQGYYRTLEPRLRAALQAAYATNWEEFESTLAPYGVDVFVTAPRVWQRATYYEPLGSVVREAAARGRVSGFVLAAPEASRVLFRSGDVYVVRVARRPDEAVLAAAGDRSQPGAAPASAQPQTEPR